MNIIFRLPKKIVNNLARYSLYPKTLNIEESINGNPTGHPVNFVYRTFKSANPTSGNKYFPVSANVLAEARIEKGSALMFSFGAKTTLRAKPSININITINIVGLFDFNLLPYIKKFPVEK